MKNPFRNFNIREYYPIKYDEKLGKYKIFGTSPIHCVRITSVILALWVFFVGMFLILLFAFGRNEGIPNIFDKNDNRGNQTST